MRVGLRTTHRGIPVSHATIRPATFPLITGPGGSPPLQPVRLAHTDSNGEWFGIAPFFITPARYLVNVQITYGPSKTRIRGMFDEISNMFYVNLDTSTWKREKLPTRIPGDGYNTVDQKPLALSDLKNVTTDAVRSITACRFCRYAVPGANLKSGTCTVNGPRAPIPIPDLDNYTSRLYAPVFLPPSPGWVARDIRRLSSGENEGEGPL